MAKKKVVKKVEEKTCCSHTKPAMVVGSLLIISIGLWAWMYKPELVQVISVLLILMGIKKLIWAFHCNCCK